MNIEETRVMQIYLMENNLRIRPLLSVLLSYYDKKGGGVSTIGSLSVVWTNPSFDKGINDEINRWPVISFRQTSSPAVDDNDFRPGPPLLFEFEYSRSLGCYQQI